MVLLLMGVAGNATADDRFATIVDQPLFREAFDEYYNAMSDFAVDDLRLELYETIEDAMSSGGHLGQVTLDYKTRHIETGIMQRLRQSLCGKGSLESNLTVLKRTAAESVRTAGSDSQVDFSPEEMGMIAGVTVRLIQKISLSELCSAN
ncbi:MAG: hypothetical protein ACU836_15270 [Gammaproteobacteria bacterium]